MAVSLSDFRQRSSLAAQTSFLAFALVACAEEPARSPNNGATAGTFAATAGTTGFTAGTHGGTAGTGFAGTSGDTAGTGGSEGRATQGSTALPCDIRDIVKLRCQSCHGATPLAGVPMALMSWEDFNAPSTGNPAVTVREAVAARIVNTAAPMPPAPSAMLAGTELTTMQGWISGGGQAGTDPSCAPVVPTDGGVTEPGEIPEYADNCYELRAHAPGDKNAPLMVNGENYGWFYFDAPWPVGSQAVHIETLYGDHPEVLHHWLLYAETKGNMPDGTVEYPVLAGFHPSSPTLIAGWAPGADDNIPPSHVGMALPANGKMSIEIHFYGQAGNPKPVNAGVKVCTVEKPERMRPNTATVSWLGTELGINIPPNAQNSKATGTCIPQWPAGVEEIHILRSWPHMHLLGRRMTTTIVRANGTREDMHPGDGWPFDFNNEVSHKTEYVLKKGDKIETSCFYTNNTSNTVAVGFENRYEMCFNFMTAYPANALVNAGGFGATPSFTGTSTACLSNGAL